MACTYIINKCHVLTGRIKARPPTSHQIGELYAVVQLADTAGVLCHQAFTPDRYTLTVLSHSARIASTPTYCNSL